jgi:hypothetical protein
LHAQQSEALAVLGEKALWAKGNRTVVERKLRAT